MSMIEGQGTTLRIWAWGILLCFAFIVAGCAGMGGVAEGPEKKAPAKKREAQAGKDLPRIANPASVNCVERGGTLEILKGGAGEYGICVFKDGRQCEEWAMVWGECPTGGVTVQAHFTPAARYCVTTGGTYLSTGDTSTEAEQGICMFINGKACDVWLYYRGSCSRTY